VNRSDFLASCNGVTDGSEGDREEEPVNNGESNSSIDGVARSAVAVSAVVSNTFLVLANVGRESDPDGEEHAPVGEFEEKSDEVVSSGTVEHTRGHDPDEREDGPCALYLIQMRFLKS
jgi:hypothetical protein